MTMANQYKNKRLPAPRTKYYVGEPVIVLPLSKYERLANHLTDVALLDRKTQNEQVGVKTKNSMILAETRADIKAAKRYYHIQATKETDA